MINSISKKSILVVLALLLAQASICHAAATATKPTNFRIRGAAISVGAAYSINDCTRVGITLSHQPKQWSSSGGRGYNYNATKVMTNMYYEYANSSEFTPFVMFGVGVSNSQLKWSAPGLRGNFKSGNVNNLSYEAGAGVEYGIKPNVGISVTYKISNIPGLRMKDHTDGSTLIGNWKTSNSYQQSIGIGLRYVF